MITTLEKIKDAKQNRTGYPYLMDESNLEAMFGMLDPAGQGYITVVKYKGGWLCSCIIIKLYFLKNYQ